MPRELEWVRPKEHELPSVWHEGYTTLREHEIRQRWIGEHPGHDAAAFEHWRSTDPDMFKIWAEPHLQEMFAGRDQTMADRLRALDVAEAEGRAADPSAPDVFRDIETAKLFSSLQKGEWSKPAVGDPALQTMALEAGASAHELHKYVERVTEVAAKSLIDTYVEHFPGNADETIKRLDAQAAFEPIKDTFDQLRDALQRWNEATARLSEPRPADLERLAREVRDKIEACRKALPIRGLDHLHKVQAIDVFVPAALDALSSQLARQWQARAGAPSFTGMAFRLAERNAGDKIAVDIDAKLKSSGGDYRTVWSEGRDKLLEKLDRFLKNSLKSEFKEYDLGPTLDTWKKEADALTSGKYSLARMQESVLRASFAVDKYLAAVERIVKKQDVLEGFRDLLNGLQLQLREEVALYQKWARPGASV